MLLNNLDININKKFSSNKTFLHRACVQGHYQLTELLLDKGADIEAKDKEGNTPLMYVSYESNFLIVELLLDRGAKINT